MLASTLTSKGQATIPMQVRNKLNLQAGDKVGFTIREEEVVIYKISPFDYQYHQALSNTLSEWDSKDDNEAYREL